MAASLQSLQQQVEELTACCPSLCPCVLPHGYDSQDLWGVVSTQGKSARQSFEELLDSMAARADSCFVCGASGQASTSGSDSEADEAEDSNGLSFTVLTSISFKDKSLCFKRGGFACGRCRGLRSTQRFLQFAALRIGPEHEDRQAQLLELMVHLAGVNGAPEAVQSDPDALAVWVQEVYSRAYALCVAASAIRGWQVVGPDGQALSLSSSPAAPLGLAKALLEVQYPSKRKAKQAKSPSKAARTGYEAPMGKTPSACYMRTLEAILASNAKHDKQLEVQKSKEQKEVKEEQKKVVAQPQVKAAKVDAAGGNGKVAKLQLGKVQRQAGKQIGTQGQKTGKVGHRKAQQ